MNTALETSTPDPRPAHGLRAAYRCPRSGEPLVFDAGEARAERSGHRYPVVDGVPSFHARPFDEAAPHLARATKAAALAHAKGWRAALDEAYGANDPEVAYVTDDRFRAYDAVLAITPATRVLEIGCSMGQHTVALARQAKSVHAIELTPVLARFARVRCLQEGLANVEVASGGDDVSLPYAPGSFDLVVLNLVLEWCGGASEEPHEVVQRRMLANIAHVLAPGGRLFVSTKNRYALQYLLGQKDDHVGDVRFGSALPRAVAARLLERRGKARAEGHLWSYRELEALLSDAGFGTVEGYWAVPEMRRPVAFVPADAASIRRARATPGHVEGATRLYHTLLPWVPAPLVRHVTPGLTFVATKR
ncbi:class I SAM-dependent methyltransferase [Myxococcota bacterium]|nr:class I SAM-dependent methyltransferase [Myxococcota bacterium]